MLSALLCLLVTAGPASSSPPPPAPKVLRAVSATEATPVFSVGDTLTIAVDDANLREDGSTNKKAIGTLPFGAVVKVVETAPAPVTIGLLTQRWYRIETVTTPPPTTTKKKKKPTTTKPMAGWVFGNTLTPLGDARYSVTLSKEGWPVVRFFRPDLTPRVVSVELSFVATSVSAVPTMPLADRPAVLVRSCGIKAPTGTTGTGPTTGPTTCKDSVVGQGLYGAVVLATVPSPPTPLTPSAVGVTGDGYALHGRGGMTFSIYPLQDQLRPRPDEARLIELFAADCHAVVEVDARDMGDSIDQMPLCEVRPFEQNCAPDPCWDVQETCLNDCGRTCTSCDATCAGGCDTCKAACTTPACIRACAKKRATCFTGCVKGADACRDGSTCSNVYDACTAAHRARVDAECDSEACGAWGTCGGECKTTLSTFCQEACFQQ